MPQYEEYYRVTRDGKVLKVFELDGYAFLRKGFKREETEIPPLYVWKNREAFKEEIELLRQYGFVFNEGGGLENIGIKL